MIEIKHRHTGATLLRVEAETLGSADLGSANLRGAYLGGANLARANLGGANLARAYLGSANLGSANLAGANLAGANLAGANLGAAYLACADLVGATLPDGRTWDEWLADPLAGLCTEPEVRERAVAAWGHHEWTDCPMHAAFGWKSLGDAPVDKRLHVAAFVALFDARLLPRPGGGA